ncbi:MAG: aminotransferase class IV [Bacteroidota bacterium]
MSSLLFVNYNSQLFPASEYIFNGANRAFRYGDAVFETMKVMNGRIPFYKDHHQRMINAMKYLKMDHERPAFAEKMLLDDILKTADKNKHSKSGVVRLQVFRNFGGKYAPKQNDCSYLIETEEEPNDGYLLNDKGLKISLFADEWKPIGKLSNIKSSNSLVYVLAGIFKAENKWDDVLILNSRGTLAEAVSSNVFIVKDKEFLTPPLEDGCIDGVMRKQLIGIIKSQKRKLIETSLKQDDLMQADEVFLSNAVQGIRWVSAYRTKRYFNMQARWLNGLLQAKAI